jgi:hypothetical protein
MEGITETVSPFHPKVEEQCFSRRDSISHADIRRCLHSASAVDKIN